MRGRLQEIKEDNYERPNQDWVCTSVAEGGPCPMGPLKSGRCPEAAACHPILEDDRWSCNRAESRGGPCEQGPSPDGACPKHYRCTPLSTHRKRRGRFVFGCLLFSIGALAVAFSSDWRNEFLAPGPLTVQHAQLVSRSEATNRCASCHAAGNQTVGEWLEYAIDPNLASPSQSELCMKCHREQIEESAALWAHNTDPNTLIHLHASTDVPPSHRVIDPTEEIGCSACHREHHGAQHDLTWMSNTACQSCHVEQYGSFATDHPEFDGWPNARRTRLVFDHNSHQSKHFVEKQQEFDCSKCHTTDETGEFQQTLGYEATCAECHDDALATSWNSGLAIFSLPMLDTEALADAGSNVGQWPEDATGEFDGALPSVAKLLLATDAKAARAMQELGADFDFFDVDPEDSEQVAAAADIVLATKLLYRELATDGQEAIRQRLARLLGRDVSQRELTLLTAHLSPENIAAINEQWLAESPTADESSSQDRAAARQKVSAGGWFRDELTFSIRYQPTGHADPFVTAWLDLLAEASAGTNAAIAQPLLRQEMSPTAPGQCGSCHSVDRLDTGAWVINWVPKQPSDRGRGFTFFNHGPHLTQAELADCSACHAIDQSTDTGVNYQHHSPRDFVDGFHPLTRTDCAQCHIPQAAGDSCLKCHRYHVGE